MTEAELVVAWHGILIQEQMIKGEMVRMDDLLGAIETQKQLLLYEGGKLGFNVTGMTRKDVLHWLEGKG